MSDQYTTPLPPPSTSGLSDNIAGGLAYITIIPAIIFLLIEPYKSRPFVRFHCFQNLGIFVVQIILQILAVSLRGMGIGVLTLILGLLSLVVGILLLVALIMAFMGKKFVIPVIGPIAEKYAGTSTF